MGLAPIRAQRERSRALSPLVPRTVNAASGTIGTTTATLSTGLWYRIEGYVISGASTGQAGVNIYGGNADWSQADSLVPVTNGSLAATGQTMSGNNVNRTHYGLITNQTSVGVNIAGVGWSDVGPLGPLCVPAAA